MSFFKKLGRKTKHFFKKTQRGVHNLARKAEKGLGEASRIAKVGETVLDNPVTVGLASAAFGPEAGLAVEGVGQGLGAFSRIAGKASQVARETKEISDPRQTENRLRNPRDTLERAKRIKEGAEGVRDDTENFFRPSTRPVIL